MIDQFENGTLIPEKDWIDYIISLEKDCRSSTKDQVKQALVNSIIKRIPRQRFGIFFSGGVDSTLISYICKKQNADFICYSVGLKDAPDIIEGRKVADELGLTLKQKIFTIEEVEELFKKVIKIFDKPDILRLGVGAVIVAAAELAKQDKINTFFGGLGSEEIFAGYERHLKASDVHAECWKGLKGMWQRDFTRDYAVAKAMNIKVLIPFLDEELIRSAMGIPGNLKINKDHKKVILREIAEELGLKKEFAWRLKKAAQYGSWFDKAMEKLAKQNDFKTKQDYIDSLK